MPRKNTNHLSNHAYPSFQLLHFHVGLKTVVSTKRWRMYQRKVDVDMLNAVKSLLADVSSISPSSEQSYNIKTYPHQPHVDTFFVLPLRRRRLKLVLTGTSIPTFQESNVNNLFFWKRHWRHVNSSKNRKSKGCKETFSFIAPQHRDVLKAKQARTATATSTNKKD